MDVRGHVSACLLVVFSGRCVMFITLVLAVLRNGYEVYHGAATEQSLIDTRMELLATTLARILAGFRTRPR